MPIHVFAGNRNIVNYTYLIIGSSINIVTRKKDLGILFCLNLEFHYHIDAVCCSAFKMVGFVIRTSTEFKLSCSFKALYCSLVLPLLEYSSILRDPFTTAESSHIERIQRRYCSSASLILQIPIHRMIIGE